MRKQVVTTVAAMAFAFLAGAIFNDYIVDNYSLRKANDFKMKVIKAQDECINTAEEVMENNGLYDTNGSDAMADYMEACNKVIELYNTK